jgi:hypothetical protein
MSCVLAVIGSLALLAFMAGPAGAADIHNPNVLPPQSHPYGATYGQWSAHWWQWLYQTPVSASPEFSAPGTPGAPVAVDCTAGQSGPVWVIGGTFLPTSSTPQVSRSDVYRTCSVPASTPLFFPILNTEADNLACDANGNPTSLGFTATQLRSFASGPINDIVPGSMSATIDKLAVSGIASSSTRYRATAGRFTYTMPADNVGPLFGCKFPAGTMPPTPGAYADGVYLMLKPLPPGTHVVHFGGEIKVPGQLDFIENINYTITVS